MAMFQMTVELHLRTCFSVIGILYNDTDYLFQGQTLKGARELLIS